MISDSKAPDVHVDADVASGARIVWGSSALEDATIATRWPPRKDPADFAMDYYRTLHMWMIVSKW
jgi:hypothetical protein